MHQEAHVTYQESHQDYVISSGKQMIYQASHGPSCHLRYPNGLSHRRASKNYLSMF